MPRSKVVMPPEGSFGERLAQLRKEAGFSQRQLGDITGISQRMIAYYEKREALPPGHILTELASALGLSVDELVAKANLPEKPRRPQVSQRILRRLQEIEKLPLRDKRELLAIIDTYLEKHRLTEQRRAQ